MRTAFKWLGFALVAAGVAVFPSAIWFAGPWGVAALVLVIVGCAVLVAGLRARTIEESSEEQDEAPGSDVR
jgi:hypothetical protein